MKCPAPPTTTEVTTPWAALAAACGAGLTSIHHVYFAETHPRAYLSLFAHELEERGIEQAHELTPAVALVDRLIAEGLAVEADWAETGESVTGLLRARSIIDVDLGASGALGMAEALPHLASVAVTRGAALVEIDIDSDSHPLVFALSRPEVYAAVAATPEVRIVEQSAGAIERPRFSPPPAP